MLSYLSKQTKAKAARQARRHRRVRAKIKGTAQRPRLAIFKSLANIYVQLIDDQASKTLLALDSRTISKKGTKSEISFQLGVAVAEAALKLKIKEVIFDRGPNAYHGRVKQVAAGARQGGLIF